MDQFFKIQNQTLDSGIISTPTENQSLVIQPKKSGENVYFGYNLSKMIYSCSQNPNKYIYCTSDITGLNFNQVQCQYYENYQFVSCQNQGKVNCSYKNANQSNCKYSIYYLQKYDLSSTSIVQVNQVSDQLVFDEYYRVQQAIFYDQYNLLVQIIDDPYGDFCLSIDLKLCVNSYNVGLLQNASYCLTLDTYSCYSNYGPNCNEELSTGCAEIDGINFTNLTYCISLDNQTCFQDQGQLCASSNLLNCNISINQNTCETYDGKYCFAYKNGYTRAWYYTQDGVNVYQNLVSNNKIGAYCYSIDGLKCGQVFLNLLNQDAVMCLSDNNLNCIYDLGQKCNSTILSNCNIPNNTQSCKTLDMKSCIKGFWIKVSSTPEQSGNTTFCYSSDGLTCKTQLGGPYCFNGNSLSPYLCQYQQIESFQTLKQISICLSKDGLTCYNDFETKCQQSSLNPFCAFNTTDNFCLTQDNQVCSFIGPGWFYTLDGFKVSQLFSSLLSQIGTYCYSQNGVNCTQSYGPNCNSQGGTDCANLDRINPILSTQCISYDNKTCFKDDGALCKPSLNSYDGSCALSNPNYCLTNDFGKQCLDLVSGWYYTQDNQNVYTQNEPNGVIGTYCYSKNGINCQVNYDSACSLIIDKSRCLNTTQCVSLANSKCYTDYGSMCNQTSKLNKLCNLNKNLQQCTTKLLDGKNCFSRNINSQNLAFQNQLDFINNNGNVETDYLFCFSYDGIQCFTISPLVLNSINITKQLGIYCQTKNGYTCYQDNGPNCSISSGYYCTTYDQINLALVSYCATNDNQTCVQDYGKYCDSNLTSYCNIPINQTTCVSLDFVNCYQYKSRWYFTLDQVNVYQQKTLLRQVGSYCYSYDGQYCKQNWLNFSSQNISYCISQNNQTCYQDIGSLCNNTFNDNYCFINNQTNNCETVDGLTCSTYNYIRRKNMNSLCYSYDGVNCLVTTGGIYCKNNTDYLCASKNQLLQLLTICLSYDGYNCYNCTLNNYKQCYSTADNVNYCNTQNGYTCNLLSTGYFFTYNGIHIAPLQSQVQNPSLVGVQGFFCQSDNSYRCTRVPGQTCNPRTLTGCTFDQELNFLISVQCITKNNQNCYYNSGSICGPSKSKNPTGTCDLQNTQSFCTSTINIDCYNFVAAFTYTQNIINLYQQRLSNGLNGSYCYTNNGASCSQNYGLGCNLTNGFNCSSNDRINLQKVSYCVTTDYQVCRQDLGQFCNQTGDLTNCNIYNNTKNCETLDIVKCLQKQQGWYITFDNINVVSIQQNKGYPRIYCFSDDGQKCKKNYGVSCNSTTGYLCTTTDGITPVLSIYCITYDNNTCYQDYGQLCNFTGSQIWCNILNSTNYCTTYDGITCYKFLPGWYFSLNYSSIIPSTQALATSQGSYCYSNDGQNCYYDYGVNCDPRTGYMCSTSDGINPQYINYCLTDNFKNCKLDNGAFCNFTGTQNWCNIYSYYPSCVTMYGNNKCYDILARWYLTYDGIHVNTLSSGLRGYLASYCYSYDGINCYQDYGPQCNLRTGIMCSTSNGASLLLGTYCISANNKTCYQDIGSLCNNTNMLNWCNILNTTNNCYSQDGLSCYNFNGQYCLTFDGIRCTTLQISNQKGTYCWSNDGRNCSNSGVPRCDPLKGQICQGTNVSFCVTQNNQTCLQDMGYFCNNTYDYTFCNINYDITSFCVTKDSYNCMNQSSLLKNQTTDQIQRRNIRDYFFYAIYGNINNIRNVSSVGTCDSNCKSYPNSCCTKIQRQDLTGLTTFDNLCMQKFVSQGSYNIQINGFTYSLNCFKI